MDLLAVGAPPLDIVFLCGGGSAAAYVGQPLLRASLAVRDVRSEGDVSEEQSVESVCPTCGAATTATGHLCRPFKPTKPYVCDYCSAETDDPRHMCYPQIEHLKYQCVHCGRLAAKAEALCHPKRIAGS